MALNLNDMWNADSSDAEVTSPQKAAPPAKPTYKPAFREAEDRAMEWLRGAAKNVPENVGNIVGSMYEMGKGMVLDPFQGFPRRRAIAQTLTDPKATEPILNALVAQGKAVASDPLAAIQKHPVDAAMLLSGGLGLAGKGAELANFGRTANVLRTAAEVTEPVSQSIKLAESLARPVTKLASKLTPSARAGKTLAEAKARRGAELAEGERIAKESGVPLNYAEMTSDPELMATADRLARESETALPFEARRAAQAESLIEGAEGLKGKGDPERMLAGVESTQQALADASIAAEENVRGVTAANVARETGKKSAWRSAYENFLNKYVYSGATPQEIGEALKTTREGLESSVSQAEKAQATGISGAMEDISAGGKTMNTFTKTLFDNLSKIKNDLYKAASKELLPTEVTEKLATALSGLEEGISELGDALPKVKALVQRGAQAGIVPEAKGATAAMPTTPQESVAYLQKVKTEGAPAELPRFTAQDLDALRKSAGELAYKYSQSSDTNKRYTAGKMSQLVKDIDAIEESFAGVGGIESIGKARAFFKDTFAPIFGYNAPGWKLLQTKIGGEPRVLLEQYAKMFFPSDATKVPNAVEQFGKVFGTSKEGRSGLIEAIKGNMAAMTNGDPAEISKWVNKHREAIKAYGLEKEFGNITKLIDEAEQASANLKAFDATKLGKLLNIDIESELPKQIAKSSGAKFIKDAAALLKGNPEAMSGLKRGVSEAVLGAKNAPDRNRMMRMVKESGLMSPEEFGKLQKALSSPEFANKYFGRMTVKAKEAEAAASAAAKEAVTKEREFARSKLAKLLDVEPTKLGAKLISEPSLLKKLMAHPGTKVEDIKAVLGEAFSQWSDRLQFTDIASMRKAAREVYVLRKKIMKNVAPTGIYSDAELSKFDALHDSIQRIAGTGITAVKMADKLGFKEALARAAGYAAAHGTGKVAGYVWGKEGFKFLDKMIGNQYSKVLAEALLDPPKAAALVDAWEAIQTGKNIDYTLTKLAKKYGLPNYSKATAPSREYESVTKEPEPEYAPSYEEWEKQ